MKTVTLIGSGRFDQTYQTCVALLTGLGIVVLTHGYHSPEVPALPENQAKRRILYDLLMLDKISRSDAVLVIDVDSANDQPSTSGYVGEETAKEILWASLEEIPVAFLSDLLSGCKVGGVGRAMSDFNDAMTDGEVLIIHVDPCLDILEHVTGRERAKDAQDDTKLQVMRAGLSHFARMEENSISIVPPSKVAQDILTFLDLEPMSEIERMDYLRMVDPNSSIHDDREVIGG